MATKTKKSIEHLQPGISSKCSPVSIVRLWCNFRKQCWTFSILIEQMINRLIKTIIVRWTDKENVSHDYQWLTNKLAQQQGNENQRKSYIWLRVMWQNMMCQWSQRQKNKKKQIVWTSRWWCEQTGQRTKQRGSVSISHRQLEPAGLTQSYHLH